MKYLTLTVFLILSTYASNAQAKGDTTKPSFFKIFTSSEYIWRVHPTTTDEKGCIWAWGRNKSPEIWNTIPPSDSIPDFRTVIFLMQQNMELSERLDRAERKIDSTETWLLSNYATAIEDVKLGRQVLLLSYQEDKNAEQIRVLTKRVDSLERRPYLFIDLNKQQPGVWLTNKEGEYMWYIAPINIK